MKVLRYFETSLTSRPTTNNRIKEFTDLQQRRCKQLKSRYTRHFWPRPSRPAFETRDRLPIVTRWTHKRTWCPRFADPKTFTWSCHTAYFRSPLNMRWKQNNNLLFACRPWWCTVQHTDKQHGIPWWRNAETDVNQWFPKCGPRIPRDPRPLPRRLVETFPQWLLWCSLTFKWRK